MRCGGINLVDFDWLLPGSLSLKGHDYVQKPWYTVTYGKPYIMSHIRHLDVDLACPRTTLANDEYVKDITDKYL